MPEYTVVDLDEAQLEAAYFLMRAIDPDLSREEWLARSRGIGSSAGVLGLCGPDGTLLGLLVWRKLCNPRNGATLAIERLVVFELTRLGSGKRMLLDAAGTLADRLGCSAVAYSTDEPADKYKTAIGHAAPRA